LALDADVILIKDWLERIENTLVENIESNIYAFSFKIRDKFFGIIDRGNHFCNGKYASKSRQVLNEITRFSGYPENDIKKHIENIDLNHYPDIVIGYHGFEQYYKDVYYRFWNSHRRKMKQNRVEHFLAECKEKQVLDRDYQAAYLGWQSFGIKDFLLSKLMPRMMTPKQVFHKKIGKTLAQKGIIEKVEYNLKYADYLKSMT
jgi:hypothetical protein